MRLRFASRKNIIAYPRHMNGSTHRYVVNSPIFRALRSVMQQKATARMPAQAKGSR